MFERVAGVTVDLSVLLTAAQCSRILALKKLYTVGVLGTVDARLLERRPVLQEPVVQAFRNGRMILFSAVSLRCPLLTQLNGLAEMKTIIKKPTSIFIVEENKVMSELKLK